MGVEKDQLFAVMNAIILRRQDQGFHTDTRQLRLLLEFGAMDAKAACQSEELNYSEEWLNSVHAENDNRASCWINPNGSAFWIAYANHSTFCAGVTGSSDTGLLEQANWVHVSDKRIDILRTPTSRQAAVIDGLLARGFRKAVLDTARKLADTPAVHPGLAAGPISDYVWDDPRYWEARGIPRIAHGRGLTRPNAELHVREWAEKQRGFVYAAPDRYNPYYVLHAQITGDYISRSARALSADKGVVI